MDILNDSRETVIIIYASTVLLLIGCLVLAVLYQSANVLTIVWSIVVFTVAMIHLVLTFVPKVSDTPVFVKKEQLLVLIQFSEVFNKTPIFT